MLVEAWCFSLSSFLLLFPQHFGRYVLSTFDIPCRFDKHMKMVEGLYRLKRCGKNDKDKDNTQKTLNDKKKEMNDRNLGRMRKISDKSQRTR